MPSPFIFADTSAWYAYVDKSDAHHPAAIQFIQPLTTPLVTSTYIFDETVTLIKAHLGHRAAILFGEKLRQEQIAKLLRITEQDEQRAWEIFVRYHDKGFSFTDCTSFALMERLQIDTVFAFDEHFRQYGKFVAVPPLIPSPAPSFLPFAFCLPLLPVALYFSAGTGGLE